MTAIFRLVKKDAIFNLIQYLGTIKFLNVKKNKKNVGTTCIRNKTKNNVMEFKSGTN